MINKITDTINQVLGAVSHAAPGGLTEDVEKNMRAALSSVFERLDLVTREELEVQEAVLARTREKLERLEQQVRELENKLNQ